MNRASTHLSESQLGFLQEVMECGNSQVKPTLEMLTAQTVDQLSIQLRIIPSSEVSRYMDMNPEPLATVIGSMHGDVEGMFYFLQSKKDFLSLGHILIDSISSSIKRMANEPTEYLIPDWLKEQRSENLDTEELEAQMFDAVSEMGNVLFGIYLTALYNGCKLGVYYDTPTNEWDDQHLLLEQALRKNKNESNCAFVIRVDYTVAGENLRAWLLMLPDLNGLRAMIDSR
jgi:chemotaxis protein CheY-P-specific phosphatase CheC